jgi:hypothetical protein
MTVGVAAFAAADFSILTLATGVIEVTGMLHTVAAETGTTDDLVTITAGQSQLRANSPKPGQTIARLLFSKPMLAIQ